MITNSVERNFRNILLEKCFYCIAITFLTFGCLIVYGWTSQQLGPILFIAYLWEPLAYFGSALNINIVVLIMVARYYNHKYRNHFIKKDMENPEILFLMCLPLVIFNIVTISLSLINDITYQKWSGTGNISFDLTSVIYFISILILLVQSNGLYEYGEIWIVNFINMITIIIGIVSQIFFIIFYITKEQVQFYVTILNNTSIQTDYKPEDKTISFYANNLYKSFEPFMNKSIVISGFTCSLFLMKPIVMHYKHLQNRKNKPAQNDVNYIEKNSNSLSIESMVFCISVGLLLLASTFIMMETKDKVSIYIYCCLEIIIYIIMVFFSVSLINLMKYWKYQFKRKLIFNDIMVWTGLFGQMFHTICLIATSIYNLSQNYSSDYMNGLVLLKYVLQIIQNIIQSITESILIEKLWKKPTEKTYSSITLGILFLTILNMVLGIADIALVNKSLSVLKDPSFSWQLFFNLFYRIGTIFSILHRFHGSFLFYSYIKFIYTGKEL